MDFPNTAFLNRLRDAVSQRGGMRAFCRAANVSHPVISKLLHGKQTDMKMETYEKILAHLPPSTPPGCQTDRLLLAGELSDAEYELLALVRHLPDADRAKLLDDARRAFTRQTLGMRKPK